MAEVNAGIAVEYLAKALLARNDPLSIVRKDDPHSAVVMSGEGHTTFGDEYVSIDISGPRASDTRSQRFTQRKKQSGSGVDARPE